MVVVAVLAHDKLWSLEDTLQNFLAIATRVVTHTHGPTAWYQLMIYLQLNCNIIYQYTMEY